MRHPCYTSDTIYGCKRCVGILDENATSSCRQRVYNPRHLNLGVATILVIAPA